MEIYITRNGQQIGPYSVHEANRNLSAGKIDPSDLAWHAALSEWVPLSTVPGIMASPPPPPRRHHPPPVPTGSPAGPEKRIPPASPGLPPIVTVLGVIVIVILGIAMVVNIIVALPVAIAGVPIGTILIFIIWKALANIGKNKK